MQLKQILKQAITISRGFHAGLRYNLTEQFSLLFGHAVEFGHEQL